MAFASASRRARPIVRRDIRRCRHILQEPREGGSITAAQFINRFVENGTRWAHLDIAGMAWSDKPNSTYDKGATGYGVRLIDRFVEASVEGR